MDRIDRGGGGAAARQRRDATPERPRDALDGAVTDDDLHAAFAVFVADVEPRLRRAYIGWCGVDGARDATVAALGWAWEHWADVTDLTNPVG
ncbi:MAG: hypothetical protein JJE52_12610 [Acidimicrobiia bacterium]|nr:hypothetical protein [Acidimicrobiia bacterium]